MGAGPGSGQFNRVSIEGIAGNDTAMDTQRAAASDPGVNVQWGVGIADDGVPGGVFEMTTCTTQNVGGAFALEPFKGRATIGGSPAEGNTFLNSGGGQYGNLDGATVSESYDRIEANAASVGDWAISFGETTVATSPSTVVFAHNTVAVDGPNCGGIDVYYSAQDTLPCASPSRTTT